MYQLHIANKNYSSWSLRPWILMKELGISFQEILHPFGMDDDWAEYLKLNPSGLVPCLIDNTEIVWDSLSIIEYLAEKHDAVWPADAKARAWARCAASEMHSGFFALRNICSMNCGVRIKLNDIPHALSKDLERIEILWKSGLEKFGGAFLAGDDFSAVDAFFAPVVFRLQTYGIHLSGNTEEYMQRILALKSMLQWYEAALAETFRDAPHESEVLEHGEIIADLRKS